MATGYGLRFAHLRLPTPGSGFDDQDRYALLGVTQPANSITPPAIGGDFDSKQRFAWMRIVAPDSTLDDAQDRHTYLGVVQPTFENVNISAQQRAHFCRIPMWPGGAGFTANDRFHAMGVYPFEAESVFEEPFDVDYAIVPAWTEVSLPDQITLSFDIVVGGVISGISMVNTSATGEFARRVGLAVAGKRVEFDFDTREIS